MKIIKTKEFFYSLNTLWYSVRNLGVTWFFVSSISTDLHTSVAQEHLNLDALPDINMIERESNTGPLFLKDPCPIHTLHHSNFLLS